MRSLQATELKFDFTSIRSALQAGITVTAIVAESFRRADSARNEGIFTELVPFERLMHRAALLQKRAESGEKLPLLGLPFAVKDNLHVAGMATTSNCPALLIMPMESAHAITLVEDAGALLIGKNTMDQFATGLNGTRSPEPLCRNAINPDYIPGGSSSGSAVAVARDMVSFSLGSDTGGSGRVPAACNGIVGLKPTIGLVSTRGLLFNSRYFDCVPVFAKYAEEAFEILDHIAGYDEQDPRSRSDAFEMVDHARTNEVFRILVPRSDQLNFFGDHHAKSAFYESLEIIETQGLEIVPIDFSPYAEAGQLVFSSAFVAERLVDYGEVIEKHRDSIHPAVLAAIEPGAEYSAADAFAAIYRLQQLRRRVQQDLSSDSLLVVPTIPTIFTINEMLAEPMQRNAIMGTYTYFVNPLDLCAVSIPAVGRLDGLPSAISLVGLAGMDGSIRRLAMQLQSKFY